MKIVKKSTAGTLESSDCLVTVTPANELIIQLESVSKKRFGQQLNALIEDTLAAFEIDSGYIEIIDRGALDYCLRARIITAIKRSIESC